MADQSSATPLGASSRVKGVAFTYTTLLRDFIARFPATVSAYVGVEMAQVAFQSAIGAFVLIFINKVGGEVLSGLTPSSPIDEGGAAVEQASAGFVDRLNNLAASPDTLINTLSDRFDLQTLLAFFLLLISAAALSSFIASFVLNRRAREYEDFLVRRALTRLSNIGFNELAELRRWMPLDRNSAFRLIQTDARMTAISGRLLTYAVAAFALMALVLLVLLVIDWQIGLAATGLLLVASAPLLILMLFGSRHSDEMLERAPGLAKEKQKLLEIALARPQRLQSDEQVMQDAFARDSAIGQFMNTFETRFQILSVSTFVFTLVTNLVLIGIGFFLVVQVLSGVLDPALLVVFLVVLSLLVRAFRQVASFMTTVSRLHRPVETHQRFIAATSKSATSAVLPVRSFGRKRALPLNSKVDGVKSGESLKPGAAYAILSREPASRFWAYDFFTLALDDPHAHGAALDHTVLLDELPQAADLSIVDLTGSQRPLFAKDYKALQKEVADIWAADPDARSLTAFDWPIGATVGIGDRLAKPGLSGIVRVLGAARFAGSILFVHAAVLDGMSEKHRAALFKALGEETLFLFHRRSRPELFAVREHLSGLILKTPGDVSFAPASLLERQGREVMDRLIAQEAEREAAADDPSLFDAI